MEVLVLLGVRSTRNRVVSSSFFQSVQAVIYAREELK